LEQISIPPGFNKVSLAVDFLLPGTAISSVVFDKKGTPLLEEKIPFTAEFIESLKKRRIERIYYLQKDENSPGTIKKPVSPSSSHASEILGEKVILLAHQVTNEIEQAVKNKEFIQTTNLQRLIDILIKTVSSYTSFPAALIRAKQQEDDFCSHAVNVSILSMITAFKHGFDLPLIKQIGIGAFIHDIGKFSLPPELLNKSQGYTPSEIEELKKHTSRGFELIKLNGQLTSIVRKVVLLHHESTNGSGYPLGLHEKDVGYYPFIVSLANIFDNLTTHKKYRSAYSLKDTLSMIIQTSGKKLPAYLVQIFIKNITKTLNATPQYKPGLFVELNTQEVAQVVSTNLEFPSKPVVRIVRDSSGQNTSPHINMDLSTQNTRFIEKALSPEIQKQLALRYHLPEG